MSLMGGFLDRFLPPGKDQGKENVSISRGFVSRRAAASMEADFLGITGDQGLKQ
jgi:hypothetical protein